MQWLTKNTPICLVKRWFNQIASYFLYKFAYCEKRWYHFQILWNILEITRQTCGGVNFWGI